jgi:predicted transcriptional regulator
LKKTKRSKLEIYCSILRALDSYGGAGRITHLSYASGTPLDRTKGYLKFLADAGLVRAETTEDGVEYMMTPRGYEFLRAYSVVNSLVDIGRDKTPS